MENIKLVCEGAEENWIEFKPTITQGQVNRYLKALTQKNAKDLDELYRETVADCRLVLVDGSSVQGIEAVLAENFEERLPIPVVIFWSRAFGTAVKALRNLGNPQRRS